MMTVVATIVALLVGLVAGVVLATVLAPKSKDDAVKLEQELQRTVLERDAARGDVTEAKVTLAGAVAKAEAAAVALASAQEELKAVREAREVVERERSSLESALAEKRARAEAETKAFQEKIALLTEAREVMKTEFEALSGKIFDAKAKIMNEQGATSLDRILKPVKDKLGEFQSKVEGFQQQHVKDTATLGNELKHLNEVSRGITEEASRLTRALTTQSQVRGAWGEQVLARVLEVAGLREGIDFVSQEVHRREDGTMPRPDVVVNLPGGRRIVVDAKLSMIDYTAYSASTDDAERAAAMKRHVAAVRQHIRELSDKRYTEVLGGDTLDFVIAFVPIEQAYLAAVEAENGLYDEAWKRHVMFACPSTLLYALRMVSYLWVQEAQAKNVEEVVKRGAELYDKFVGFTEDLMVVGAALKKADAAYDGALSKLSTGKGNAVRQVEMLRGLGLRPSKSIPQELLDNASLTAVPPEITAP